MAAHAPNSRIVSKQNEKQAGMIFCRPALPQSQRLFKAFLQEVRSAGHYCLLRAEKGIIEFLGEKELRNILGLCNRSRHEERRCEKHFSRRDNNEIVAQLSVLLLNMLFRMATPPARTPAASTGRRLTVFLSLAAAATEFSSSAGTSATSLPLTASVGGGTSSFLIGLGELITTTFSVGISDEVFGVDSKSASEGVVWAGVGRFSVGAGA